MCREGGQSATAPALKRAAWSSPGGWLGGLEAAYQASEALLPAPAVAAAAPSQAQQQRRRRTAAAAQLLIVLALLVGARRPGNQGAAEAGAEAGPSEPRTYLKAGALYQNEYMTLWNENGMAISVKLRILEGDRFELAVEHLNSAGGGGDGWLAVRGAFRTEPLPGVNDARRRQLVPDIPAEGFDYDEAVLEPGTAFTCRCVRRLGISGLLRAIRLEVDTVQDAVIIAPRSTIIRMLWDAEVALRPTSKELAWEPGRPGAGYKHPGGGLGAPGSK